MVAERFSNSRPVLVGGGSYHVIYSFRGGQDGAAPAGSLAVDPTGNLYGTTQEGGSSACGAGCGTVFKMTPSSGGSWTENVLYRFNGADGQQPISGVTLDAAGNIYGTTFGGGTQNCITGCGIAFELTPSGGQWNETVLYRFTGGSDGALPVGALYGTTVFGGRSDCDCGTAFKLTPGSNGKWSRSSLYAFDGKHGAYPNAGLTFDATGNLYGTASGGGGASFGVAFDIIP